MPTTNLWTSLEVAKLLVSGLTPILILIIGLSLNKRLKKFEHRQWRNQKLIEKRLEIYDDLAPLLNDVLCYYSFVGNWKKYTPPEIINLKRDIDKKIYLAEPLFCKDFFSSSMAFMNLCYESFVGWGKDAKLRTHFQRRKDALGNNWDPNWDSLFSSNNFSDVSEIRKSYNQIMNVFSQEIGLQNRLHDEVGTYPTNY